jgi:Ca-activated chloride channel family protein
LLLFLPVVDGHTSDSLPGGLFLSSDGTWEQAPSLTADTTIEITGMVARVEIRQSFTNPTQDWLEGVYVFPLPTDAAVDTLELRVADQWIQGEIRERQQAAKIYREAKDAGRRAGLVNQDRPNLFTLSVANIPPGETVYVHIGYFHKATYVDGSFGLHFPMTVTPRYLPGGISRATPHQTSSETEADTDSFRQATFVDGSNDDGSARMSLSIKLRAGIDIESIEGVHHQLVKSTQGDAVSISPAAGPIRMDRDFVLKWTPVPTMLPEAVVYTETFAGEEYALIMLVPPHPTDSMVSVAREVVLVIDTSGSMAGAPLAQAREALAIAVKRLSPRDRFNLIEFNSETTALFVASAPASDRNKEAALEWLNGLQANGGTEMVEALQRALAATAGNRLRQVVFVTDGSVSNESQLFRLIRAQLGASRLFTVGIGPAPNRHFMEKAARFGRGTHIQIGRPDEVRERMEDLLNKLERPALTDISIQWQGAQAVQVWPQPVGDLYSGEPVVIAARTRGAGDWVNLSGSSASGHWLRQLRLPRGQSAAGVAALWAREKLSGLADRMLEAADPETVREEMIAVALEHGLVSRFTSLVAVDREPLRPAWEKVTRRDVALLAPANAIGVRLGAFPATATEAPVLLMRAFWLLVLASLLLFFRPWNSLTWD